MLNNSKTLFRTVIVLALLTLGFYSYFKSHKNIMKPPIAEKLQFSYKTGEHTIQDEYNWLRAPNWPKVDPVKDKKILDYLKAENQYADNVMFGKFKDDAQKLFEELKGRIKLADKSVEVQQDDYYYYTRTEENLDYPIHCRRKGQDGTEEIILDENELAKGHKYLKVSAFSVSPNHQLLAYSVDYTGGERYTVKVLDLATREHLAIEVPDTVGPVVWWHAGSNPSTNASPGFFYVVADENWRPTKVFYRPLETDRESVLVLKEEDPTYDLSIGLSSSKKYLIVDRSSSEDNESYTIDFNGKFATDIKLFSALRTKVLYDVDHHSDGTFYVHTNDNSNNFRLLKVSGQDTSYENWVEHIPAKKDAYLSSFDLTQNYLVLNYKEAGLPQVQVQNLATQEIKSITFPDAAYAAGAYSTNFELDDIRIGYSSLCRPETTYSYDFASNKLAILKTQEIPSGLDPDAYQVERVWTENKGVKVPVSILYKKSLKKGDGSNPMFLYGYGSYGIGIPANFKSSILSLVDRGFIFAIAHVRGGNELGRQWYEDAKFLTKKLTFSDFIAVAEDMIQRKYTSKGNIVVVGRSAGGMLVGNVINERPELFKAAVAEVPFVTVLDTMLDTSLPLTPGEFKEWGNPAEEEYFQYIKSYSPYDNIKSQDYPAIYAAGSISDPRVGYYEPAKWIARIRAHNTSKNLILLKTNLDSGHAGASGRFDYLKEIADEYLFLLKVFDIPI